MVGAQTRGDARVLRGDIWLVSLDPRVGSEIQKTRPCVIVSPPEMNDHLRTVLAAPMTTGSRPAPFRVELAFAGRTGFILLDQMRALDKLRLTRRLGSLGDTMLALVLRRLGEMFAP